MVKTFRSRLRSFAEQVNSSKQTPPSKYCIVNQAFPMALSYYPGVADVYVDKRSRVWLLDINPFSVVTDSLLFDWSEDVLAAPLPPKAPKKDGDETLPPDVFLRLHIQATDVSPSHGVITGPASDTQIPTEARDGSNSRSEPEEEKCRTAVNTDAGFVASGRGVLNFCFRCVPSNLHIMSDPMGRYRGPADVDMGTLLGGTEGNGDFEHLIETCRHEDATG